MVTVVCRYDLRAPGWAATRHPELYRLCLEQCAWADELGVDQVILSEHHGTTDGYLPAPFTMAAAIGARTNRVMITVAAALVPLHDPVRLAEEIAVAQLVSGGRIALVAGIGYVPDEFRMAGVEPRGRGRLAEEHLEVMQRAWTGEPFTWRGREIRVTPAPPSPPMVLYGGSSAVAARRAARLRLGFLPAVDDPELERIYAEACEAEGWEGGFCLRPRTSGYVFLSEDPDRTWAALERYFWYDAESYRAWQVPGVRSEVASAATTPAALREEGLYRVLTPEQCLAACEELGPGGTLVLHPLLAGLPAGESWASLELFASAVWPKLRGI